MQPYNNEDKKSPPHCTTHWGPSLQHCTNGVHVSATVRNPDTVRYPTNDRGYPIYPYISKRAKQSTTETQDSNHSNTYYIPGRQSQKTNDKHIIKHAI